MEVVVTADHAYEGLTNAFTNIVGWAASPQEFQQRIHEYFAKQGWHAVDFENIRMIDSNVVYQPEIEVLIEKAETNPLALLYSTFHFYGPE